MADFKQELRHIKKKLTGFHRILFDGVKFKKKSEFLGLTEKF